MSDNNVPAPAQSRALSPIEGFRSTLQSMEKEFAVALPPQIPVGKFVRTVITTVQMNPQLLECDRRSLFATAMKAAQDGLLLDGREAAAWCSDKNGPMVQYMPMIGGLLEEAAQFRRASVDRSLHGPRERQLRVRAWRRGTHRPQAAAEREPWWRHRRVRRRSHQGRRHLPRGHVARRDREGAQRQPRRGRRPVGFVV
jgi:hypothetical protein